MGEQVELKKVYGDVFFTAWRVGENDYIYSQWFGVQSVETVKEGCYKLLDMMKEAPSSKLLNSNKHVIGSWDMALYWAKNVWAPQMKILGLLYFAQVVPTSFLAANSIENLLAHIDSDFELKTFAEDTDAQAWLLSLN